MLALLLVSASVGISNLAAAIAIGVTGVDARTRLRVGLVFGAFETGMPILGLLLGQQVAAPLGHAARWLGASLLIGVGGYALFTAFRSHRRQAGAEPAGRSRLGSGRLILSGLALSLDNLVVGFALGTYGTPIITSAVVIGVVSVVLSLIGLELGGRLGKLAGERGEQLAGVVLITVGIAVAAGALS